MLVSTTLSKEPTATSQTCPDKTIIQATAEATAHLTGIDNIKVKEVEVLAQGGKVAGYWVTLEVTYARQLRIDGVSRGSSKEVPRQYHRG
jgi:flavin-binding protein dodecin